MPSTIMNNVDGRTMRPALVPVWDRTHQACYLPEDATVTFGRHEQNDYVLALDGIAEHHCELQYRDGMVVITPIGEAVVWVDNDPISGPTELQLNDSLAIGAASFRVQLKPAPRASFQSQNNSLQDRINQLEQQVVAARMDPPVVPVASPTPAAALAPAVPVPPPVPVEPVAAPTTPSVAEMELESRAAAISDREARLEQSNRQAQAKFQASQERLKQQQDKVREDYEKLQAQRAEFAREQAQFLERMQQQKAEAAASSAANAKPGAEGELSEELEARLREVETREKSMRAMEVEMRARQQVEQEIAGAMSAIQKERDSLAVDIEKERQAAADLRHENDALQSQQEELKKQLASSSGATTAPAVNEEHNDREKALDAREEELRKQMELARKTEDATAAKSDQLARREAELAALESDLAKREAEVAAAATAVPEKDDSAEVADLQQKLDDKETAVQQAIAARDDLAATVNELQSTLSDIKDRTQQQQKEWQQQLEAAKADGTVVAELKARLEAATEELASRDQSQQALQQQLEAAKADDSVVAELTTKLQSATDELASRDLNQQSLQQQLTAMTAELQSQQAETEALQANADTRDNDELERQVAELQQKLQQAEQQAEAVSDAEKQLQQQRETIADLQEQLKEATAATGATDPAEDDVERTTLIAELSDRVRDQHAEIERLQALATAEVAEESSVTAAEEARTLHRELDERIVKLDAREEEMRERQRQIENTEEELEAQRRDLREARQQLELARAEIHTLTPDNATNDSLSQVNLSQNSSTEDAEAEAPAVRSEIADLFGLKTNSETESAEDGSGSFAPLSHDDSEPISVATSSLSAVDEYSQEASAAVEMNFGKAESVLLVPNETAAEEPQPQAAGDDPDQVVANYMEQLLARNRGRAGESLPKELKSPEPAKAAAPASASASSASVSTPQISDLTGVLEAAASAPVEIGKQNKPPESPSEPEAAKPSGPRSFIDAYMAGEYSDEIEGAPTAAAVEPAVALEEAIIPRRPEVPRQKIDLDELRSNMNSFRELSTKSVENALATHAKRQEEGGIRTRVTLFVVLAVVTVGFVGACIAGVVPFGVVALGLIAVTTISGLELANKMWQLRQKVKQATEVLANATHDTPGPKGAAYAANLQTANPPPEVKPVAEQPATEEAASPAAQDGPAAAPGGIASAYAGAYAGNNEPPVASDDVSDLTLPPEVESLLKQKEGEATSSPKSSDEDKYYEL